jgi:hypothetical protein
MKIRNEKVKLNAETCIKILEKNMKFKVESDPDFNKVLIIPSKEAYLFSSITNSVYLTKNGKIFSPFGKINRLFSEVANYNLMFGVFDNLQSPDFKILHSPLVHQKNFEYLFDTDKRLLFVDVTDSSQEPLILKEINKKIIGRGDNPIDYIVYLVFLDSEGFKMEHFCEYLACKVLKEQGFITYNQLELSYNKGKPDIGAVKIKSVQNLLHKEGLIGGGFFLIELSLLRIFKNKLVKVDDRNFALVGDAKTSSTMATTQLKKYLTTKFFNYAFEFIPNKPKPEKGFALFYIDKDLTIEYKQNQIKNHHNIEKQKIYFKWMENQIKIYLLLNLDLSELKEWFNANSSAQWNSKNFIELVKNSEIKEIVKFIKKVI